MILYKYNGNVTDNVSENMASRPIVRYELSGCVKG